MKMKMLIFKYFAKKIGFALFLTQCCWVLNDVANGMTARIEDTSSSTCTYEWEVLATFVPKHDPRTGKVERIEDAVSRAINIEADQPPFEKDATMRLIWVLSRKVGVDAERIVDWRATSQAYGIGIVPKIEIEWFFWDMNTGPLKFDAEKLWNTDLIFDSSVGAWILDVSIERSSSFSATYLRTTATWSSGTSFIDICNSLS